MKRNMLSIIILALLVINTVLTGVVMLSVMQTNQKTAAVISDIADAVELEAGGGSGDATGFGRDATNVPASERANFDISDITISLASSDGKSHFLSATVTITMDTQNTDYATYGTSDALAGNTSIIKSKINEIVGKYTYEQIAADAPGVQAEIREELLTELQDYFKSSFIIDVTFPSFLTT